LSAGSTSTTARSKFAATDHDKFLELAANGYADSIVSANGDLLALNPSAKSRL
jgi:hypothetical protein